MLSRPSGTAIASAAARAAHLVVDSEPLIYADTGAASLLMLLDDPGLAFHSAMPREPILAGARASAVARVRCSQDLWGRARRPQVVILGAGLDTAAYVWPLDRAVTVFEVDRSETIAWKRNAVQLAGLVSPATVHHVAAELGSDELGARLVEAGLDPHLPTFVSGLGVTMYLHQEAVRSTLAEVSGLAASVEVVADYIVPESLRDDAASMYAKEVGGFARERGEPWLSTFTPGDLDEAMGALGFTGIEHLAQREWLPAGLWERTDGLLPSDLSMIVHGATGGETRGGGPSLGT